MIWKTTPTLEALNASGSDTLVDHLSIEFVDFGDDFLAATMPVDHRTVQPFRLLHGGASVALAETMGSVASMFCLDDPAQQAVVGVEINANHLRSAREGDTVRAVVRPIKVGRSLHVWEIKTFRSDEALICVSRITIMVVDRRK
ncbi:MAG: hotdog fold thioesterase [Bacteroidota bacterium]